MKNGVCVHANQTLRIIHFFGGVLSTKEGDRRHMENLNK